jgi:transcriptional regulator of acetoin/glycerol metabolism
MSAGLTDLLACVAASQAAAALGLSRTRFYTLMRRYGLS